MGVREFMKMFTKIVSLSLLFLLTAALYAETCVVTSPQELVRVKINAGKQLTWSVSFDNKTVLKTSRLGLAFKNQAPCGEVKIAGTKTEMINKTWKNRFSKKNVYVDRCLETTIDLEEVSAPNRKFSIIVRAYDDGLALRYFVPKQKGFDSWVLTDDLTEYAFEGDWDCWPSDHKKFNTSQEKHFPKMKLSGIKAESAVICPLVVSSEKFGYCALTEADLIDYAGMQFAAASKANTLKLRLTPRRDGNGAVVGNAPLRSPWRVMLLGKKPVDLINNSGIILNVSTPCVLTDTDWIQPGASSWDWWSEGNLVLNTDTFKQRVDLSAKFGWKYTTLDDPWYFNSYNVKKPGVQVDTTKGCGTIDIPEAIRYANSKGVGIFVWMHYKDLITCTREKTFAAYEKWGIKGIKIDFMDSDCQEMVQWLNETVAMCAKHHLMVNYHGMYKPVGFERTYPNQITREGILGNEYNKFSKLVTTGHCATLPFTRYLCGPGDFTPGGFLNVQPENFKTQKHLTTPPCLEQGTRAHALAMCLVVDSPILTICDRPENYKNQPGADLLKDIPAVWDASTALDGQIGEFYLVSRRSGDKFYAAAITNENARELTLPLSFLKAGKNYSAVIYADAPESDQMATKLAISKKTVKAGDVLSIKMVRNGGWSAVFTPEK